MLRLSVIAIITTEVGKRNAYCLVVHARDCESSSFKIQWHHNADTLAEKQRPLPMRIL